MGGKQSAAAGGARNAVLEVGSICGWRMGGERSSHVQADRDMGPRPTLAAVQQALRLQRMKGCSSTLMRFARLSAVCLLVATSRLAGGENPRDDQEALLVVRDGGVSLALISDGAPDVQRVSPPDERVDVVGVLPDQESVWLLGGRVDKTRSRLSRHGLRVIIARTPKVADRQFGLAMAPDGKALAYVAREKAGYALYSQAPPGGPVRRLSRNWRAVMAPSWSPTGRLIAYYAAEEGRSPSIGGLMLRVLDIASGDDRQVAPPSLPTRYGGQSRSPAIWSNVADKLFCEARYKGDPVGVFVYQADPAGRRRPVRVAAGLCSSVSGDGATIYVTYRGVHSLNLSPARGRTTQLVPWPAAEGRASPSGRAIAFLRPDGLYHKLLDGSAEAKLVVPFNSASSIEFHWVRLRDGER